MYNLSGKVIAVTGAAGPLGQAVVRVLAATGARVGLIDYKSGRLDQLFPDLNQSAQLFKVENTDAASLKAMQTALNEIKDRYDGLDALVTTVGGYAGGSFVQDTDEAVLARMFKQHVHTVLAAAHAVAPIMEAQGSGVIVTVGAQSALKAGSRNGAYSAAKAAGLRLTESLAAGLKKNSVRVYSVLPDIIDTPENRRETPNADYSKWTSPESIANIILFLISDESRAISQVAISV